MRTYQCTCGASVFWENSACLSCGNLLGFDPETFFMVTLDAAGTSPQYRLCKNGWDFKVCNWVVPSQGVAAYCRACELNQVIPDLSVSENLGRWKVLEDAKRRLLFDLLELGLPVSPAHMRFIFIQDQSSHPGVAQQFVATGHSDGIITINVAEADDLHREATRLDLGERYRTVLGHFRHESGHCYWPYLFAGAQELQEFRDLFGDERADYATALDAYYAGARSWVAPEGFVTPYAASHPWEDWAESWAHYLHIRSALMLAAKVGWVESEGFDLNVWIGLVPKLNELSRCLGQDDLYPFVISAEVAAKLTFVHQRIAAVAQTN